MFREWKQMWSSFVHISWNLQRLVSGEGYFEASFTAEERYFKASFTAETRHWCGKGVTFISFTVKNKKPVSLICEITPVLEKKTLSSDCLKCWFCRSDWYRFECCPPHTVKKLFNPLSIFTVGKMESSACICEPKCALRSNFGHFEPKNLKKKKEKQKTFILGVCFQELI